MGDQHVLGHQVIYGGARENGDVSDLSRRNARQQPIGRLEMHVDLGARGPPVPLRQRRQRPLNGEGGEDFE